MNNTKDTIGWCDFSINPIIGCNNNCSKVAGYKCYAELLNDRFKFILNWDEPQFFPNRLAQAYLMLKNKKGSKRIFVGSMCDIFSTGVQKEWIDDILRVCKALPQHTFMFLTKIPFGYSHYDWPKNCMLGVTSEKYNETRIEAMRKLNHKGKFISIEPMLGSFDGVDLSCFDLVVVGAQTGKGNIVKPLLTWIQTLKHHNIYWKSNIKRYLAELSIVKIGECNLLN